MKLLSFSFEREPVWMLIFPLVAAAAGLLVLVVSLLLKSLR
ncbi:MAG: hypothetical protein AABN95_13195 [Acidobacteriota bacterium]